MEQFTISYFILVALAFLFAHIFITFIGGFGIGSFAKAFLNRLLKLIKWKQ